jgi:hypothetical protein
MKGSKTSSAQLGPCVCSGEASASKWPPGALDLVEGNASKQRICDFESSFRYPPAAVALATLAGSAYTGLKAVLIVN